MKLMKDYIKSKSLGLTVGIVVITIFLVVFTLYRLPVEPVFYASLLSIIIGGVFVVLDFLQFRKKHRSLTKLKQEITFSLDYLEEGTNLIEKDYAQLVQLLFDEKALMQSQLESKQAEMVDYYTLWVHQIKTPIAAMGLILQGQENQESKELQLQLFKIEQYVDMVLAFLRMNSESTDFLLKEYDLNDIVKQAVRKYATMFIRKKIRLEFEPLEIRVLTDEKWLVFVIEQILSNALKYTKEGKIAIYVEDKKTLVIEDTGIGIAPEDLPRIFDRGFTGYNGRMDKKASGIGLYLTKKVVGKLGHEILIESKPGIGTTVRITFPSEQKRYD